jgi:predicted TIM-barrel fold metal-dependent hydrolase
MMTDVANIRWGLSGAGHAVIDADLHCAVPAIESLFPWLPEVWREYIDQSGFKGPTDTPYPKAPTSARPGSTPPGGRPAASDLDTVRAHALDPWGTEVGILNCAYAVDSIHNPDLDGAIARAVNDWIASEWLDRDSRLRASIVVTPQQPEQAAIEIDRVARDRRFVQVLLPIRSSEPYGRRRYWPIFDAAERHHLPVGLHFGGAPGNPPTSVGWTSFYLEEYAGMATVLQSQLMSVIVEGVFDRFPTLRIAAIEAGFAWVPGWLWRFDKDWKGLRREMPWNKKLPTEYVHQHVRFTTQPWDTPSDAPTAARLIEQVGGDGMLMFATDYPHWHFDEPEAALPSFLADDSRRRILAENARAFYRLTP